MAMTGFPLLLDLRRPDVLVVGGGAVATRRVRGLLAAGARRARSSRPRSPSDRATRRAGVARRAFAAADLDGALAGARVHRRPGGQRGGRRAARRRRQIFCVRADDAAGGHRPHAGGAAPRRHDRRRQRRRRPAPGGRAARRDLAARSTSASCRRGPSAPPRRGSVALVGGGPGDPDLITVRGRRLVAAADVVVVDRLAPRGAARRAARRRRGHRLRQVGAPAQPDARTRSTPCSSSGPGPASGWCGSRAATRSCSAAAARSGWPASRPACRSTVVPGISSALAGPAAAGIPLTHRGVAADFTVVSGHLDPGRAADDGVDWPGLAAGAGTLVLLMAMDRLDPIAAELIEHGRPAQHAGRGGAPRDASPAQQVVRAPLDELAAAVRARVSARRPWS